MPRPVTFAVLGLVACATVPVQTAGMKKAGVVVSAQALRVRLRDEAAPFTGVIEQAADRMSAASGEPVVREGALAWKIGAVAALFRTLFDQRPTAALLDTWALLLQAELQLASAEARAALGPGTSDCLLTLRELESRVQEIARWAAPDRDLPSVRARLLSWAEQHPVHGSLATRDSIEGYLVSLAPGEELSAFAVAGRVSEDLDGIASRLDFLPVLVPRQATWQAELAYEQLIEPRVQQALGGAEQALGKVDFLLSWLGGPGIDALADRQRMAIMSALGAERVAAQEALDAELARTTDFVSRERSIVLEQLRQERVAATEDLRRVVANASAEGARHVREVGDHLIWRFALAQIVVCLVFVAGLWLVRRTDRRAAPPAP